ncbi:alpha/beta-hydrolase [Plenodomus tracheiphilus IPT5]|uniref:Alpha/beta-hydrolase n=1 Tax=Plenodomus tracheiphilus IPT5 TaxID=1408161 RepID=A0A6A7BNE4_9PLEO|nr:alpha/beta-hydrolase [Plenodomus tracheiphilus IPT5]
MNRLSNASLSRTPFGLSGTNLYIAIGAASLGSLIVLRSLTHSSQPGEIKTIPSPAETLLPTLEAQDLKDLPYPPHALPGSRDVPSPYGTIRVYEWGPEEGEKILLIHGISTPSIALTDLGHKLVRKGHRVMLFDLFGRGYSSAPSPDSIRYDTSLYIAQILLVLQSSTLHWSPFTILGYSLGGAIAADFTSYFPNLVKGLVLIAPGGLIRTSHISWSSKFLYSSSWMPEWMVRKMVASRLWTGAKPEDSVEGRPDTVENAETTTTSKSDSGGNSVYLSSNATLLPGSPNSTVSGVVDWQIKNHPAFVPAFISTIRYGPVHHQHARWEVIKENMEKKRSLLNEVWLVLGETDPIIIWDEVTEDVKNILGEEHVKIKTVEGAGHELAIEKADSIVRVVQRSLGHAERRSTRSGVSGRSSRRDRER